MNFCDILLVIQLRIRLGVTYFVTALNDYRFPFDITQDIVARHFKNQQVDKEPEIPLDAIDSSEHGEVPEVGNRVSRIRLCK